MPFMIATIAFASPFAGAASGPHPHGRVPTLPFTGAKLVRQAMRRTATVADACGTPPGRIGGALIKATRRGARLSHRGLAQRLAVPGSIVRGWEAGTTPLFCTDFGLLRRLAAAFSSVSRDERQLLHTLLLASQCDLLLTGMLRGFEDYAEVPPIDEDTTDGECTRGLLRWALTGTVPPPYKKHAPAGRLLAPEDVARIREVALLVQAGAQGADLKVFGCTLAMLSKPSAHKE